MSRNRRISNRSMKVSIQALAVVVVFFAPLLVKGYEGAPTPYATADDGIEMRIVGGEDAFAGEFPWFASSIEGSLCGASLISETVLMTAAHCSRAFQPGQDVYVKAYRFQSSSRGALRRTITKQVPHPSYNSNGWFGNNFDYDVMLVQLDRPITANSVTPVQLNSDGNVPADKTSVTVMGFGTTSEGGSISRDLLKVELKKNTTEECRKPYGSDYNDDLMLCASDPGQDSCQGDSGGPLIMTGTNIQVGIVSFGRGCAREGVPGVYTRISAVYDWIQEEKCNLAPSGSCDPVTPVPPTSNPPSNGEPPATPSPPTEVPPTEAPPTTITPRVETVKFVIRYNWNWDENSWLIKQGDTVLYEGPEYSPRAYSRWTTTFDEFPVGKFSFTMLDSGGNGMGGWFGNGYFEVFQEKEGKDVLLAKGDHRFDDSKTITFTVVDTRSADLPSKEDETSCQDQEGLVVQVSDDTYETCWFLSDKDEYGYLCDWVDVALACPVTCGICSDLEVLQCGADKTGTVTLDETVGEASCAFLADTEDRFGFACQRTSVALHCPVTCDLKTCKAN